MRKRETEKGFSLIELVIVCVVILIVASLAIPYLQRALIAAETGNTIATMRAISSTQLSFFSQNGRIARVTEINNIMSGGIGTPSGNEVNRGKYVFSMVPAAPTDAELRQSFTINASRNVAGEPVVYLFELTQSGEIRQVLP